MQRSRSCGRRSPIVPVLTFILSVGLSHVGEATPYVCGQARKELSNLELRIMRYELEHDELPPEATWSVALHEAGLLRAPSVPTDPWGHPIIFEHHGDDSFELMTVGYDGVRGTEDDQIRATDWADTGVCKVPRRDRLSCGS